MPEYVFLTNHYLPTPGATGMCVHQVARELIRRGERVTVVAFDDGSNASSIDGVGVVRIDVPVYMKDNHTKSALLARLRYVASLFSKLFHIREYPLRSRQLVDTYFAEVERILDRTEESIVLVASFTPIEAVIAGARIKCRYPNLVKAIYYSADTLSNEKGVAGILPLRFREAKGRKWEMELFSVYDKIIVMECHKDHYFSDDYRGFWGKFAVAGFPLLLEPQETGDSESKRTLAHNGKELVYVLYAGSLYRRFRNPRYACRLLIDLSKRVPLKAVFMGTGDCDDIMDELVRKSDGVIEYLGMQLHDTVSRYMQVSDILLSIGNSESPMAPSKIYEYMSTGKPIIHVYTYDRDPCVEPLKEYGNALLIKEGDEEAVVKAVEFVKSANRVSFNLVREKFITSTPCFTADIVEKVGQ